MTTKLPVDVNTLDDETLSLLIDESQKALDERKKYVPFVGEIIEVWGAMGCESAAVFAKFDRFNEHGRIVDIDDLFWDHYRRLDPTRILQFRDHEPGPCPCPDEEWVHVMWSDGKIGTDIASAFDWENVIIRWCPAVGVE